MIRGATAVAQADDDGDDLGALARQTLSDVKALLVPPEPFPIGFDIGTLARSSRPSRPPSEETDGRIDLAAEQRAAARADGDAAPAATPAAVVAVAQGNPAAVAAAAFAPAALPSPFGSPVVTASPSSPAPASVRAAALDRELDDLIAARAFSPSARLGALVGACVSSARRAPALTWVLLAGVGIGLAMGLSVSGTTDATAAAAPTPSTPEVALAVAPAAQPTSAATTGLQWRAYQPSAARDADRSRAAARSARSGASRGRSATVGANESPEPAPAEGEERSLDRLLDQALSPGAAPGQAAAPRAPATAGLPDFPSRDEVARIMTALTPRVRSCAIDRTGVATAQIVARSDGRITSVRIQGPPFSRTGMGRCMEGAIRSVRFPPFARPTFRVSYPFRI